MEDSYNQISNVMKTELLNQIKNGIKKTIDPSDGISVDDLLLLDSDGISYLEHALNQNVKLSGMLEEIGKSSKALNICAQHRSVIIPQYVTSDYYNEDILFEDVGENQKLIDTIFSEHINLRLYFAGAADENPIKKHPEIVDYFIKYNVKKYSLSDEALQVLLEKNNAELLKNYLNNEGFVYNVIAQLPVDKLYKVSKIINDDTILRYARPNAFMESFDGVTVLERILNSGANPVHLEYGFKNKEIIDILVRKNRIDLLYNADPSLLFQQIDSEKTYFDLMIDAHKQGVDVHLNGLIFKIGEYPNNVLAQELLKLAQNDLLNFIPSFSTLDLFKKSEGDKSVLEHMLEIDKQTTISKFFTPDKHFSSEITLELASMGIEVGPFHILERLNGDLSSSYAATFRDNYANDYDDSCADLLSEFRDLFINDGVSDQRIIETLVLDYKYLASANPELAILELKQLIAIKKHKVGFNYQKNSNSNFNSFENTVNTTEDMFVMNHETTHALHYYLADFSVPDDFFEVVQRVRDNPETIENIKMFSDKFFEIEKSLKSVSRNEIDKHYDEVLGVGKRKVLYYLKMRFEKEIMRKKYKNDFDASVLNSVLDKVYTVDEFISQSKECDINMLTNARMASEYGYFEEIADIIDAVYQGYYRDNILRDENGKFISSVFGHGTEYFSDSSRLFEEMVADYGSILKSKNSEVAQQMLRSIVGDELVDMLDNYYVNSILKSNVYLDSQELEVNGNAR